MRVDSQFSHVLSILKYNFDPFLLALVMIFVVNYIIHSTTCEQAYSCARNSGFSDFACPQVRCTAEYMPGFRHILHLTLSIYTSKAKYNRFCHTVRTHGGLILPINNFFLLTGISITRTGISNKITIQLGLGFCQNFRWEMGLGPPFRTLNTYK